MMKKKNGFRKSLTVFVLLLMTTVFAGWVQAATSQFANFVPNTFYIGSYEIGASIFLFAAPWADAVTKKYGVRARIVPTGSEVGRQILLTSGQVDVGTGGSEAYTSSRGLFTFSTLEWGPNAIQAAWFGYRQDGNSLIVRGDSPIKKLADLKGKRVAWYKGGGVQNEALVKSYLAFGGLTWADVIKVEVSSITESVAAVKDGKLDAATGSTVAAYSRELEASPYGIRFLPMPADDVEAWKRAKAVFPTQSPVYCKIGAGVSEKNPVWLTSLLVVYMVMENKPPEYTYFTTRSLHETFDSYSKSQPGVFEGWQIDKNLSMLEVSVVPYHPGSVQYFKDIGKWNDRLERLNQQKLEEWKRIRKAFETVRAEALDKGIKPADFPTYWDQRRVELLK